MFVCIHHSLHPTAVFRINKLTLHIIHVAFKDWCLTRHKYIPYGRVVWDLFTLADESQAPDTKEFWSGPSETLITSPVCPAKVIVCCPDSISQSPLKAGKKCSLDTSRSLALALSLSLSLPPILTNQVMSPDEVRIFPSSRKRHDER